MPEVRDVQATPCRQVESAVIQVLHVDERVLSRFVHVACVRLSACTRPVVVAAHVRRSAGSGCMLLRHDASARFQWLIAQPAAVAALQPVARPQRPSTRWTGDLAFVRMACALSGDCHGLDTGLGAGSHGSGIFLRLTAGCRPGGGTRRHRPSPAGGSPTCRAVRRCRRSPSAAAGGRHRSGRAAQRRRGLHP